jgi:hypothetical protein
MNTRVFTTQTSSNIISKRRDLVSRIGYIQIPCPSRSLVKLISRLGSLLLFKALVVGLWYSMIMIKRISSGISSTYNTPLVDAEPHNRLIQQHRRAQQTLSVVMPICSLVVFFLVFSGLATSTDGGIVDAITITAPSAATQPQFLSSYSSSHITTASSAKPSSSVIHHRAESFYTPHSVFGAGGLPHRQHQHQHQRRPPPSPVDGGGGEEMRIDPAKIHFLTSSEIEELKREMGEIIVSSSSSPLVPESAADNNDTDGNEAMRHRMELLREYMYKRQIDDDNTKNKNELETKGVIVDNSGKQQQPAAAGGARGEADDVGGPGDAQGDGGGGGELEWGDGKYSEESADDDHNDTPPDNGQRRSLIGGGNDGIGYDPLFEQEGLFGFTSAPVDLDMLRSSSGDEDDMMMYGIDGLQPAWEAHR